VVTIEVARAFQPVKNAPRIIPHGLESPCHLKPITFS